MSPPFTSHGASAVPEPSSVTYWERCEYSDWSAAETSHVSTNTSCPAIANQATSATERRERGMRNPPPFI